MKISHLELPLEHDLAAVGDDVSALPARDALLQLAQLVQTLLPGLAAGPVPGAEALSVERDRLQAERDTLKETNAELHDQVLSHSHIN